MKGEAAGAVGEAGFFVVADFVVFVDTVGGSSVVGGVVGAIAGDVVAGAVVGGVIGTGAALAADGDDITLPSGAKLRVRLTEAVTVKFRPAAPKEN